MSDYDDDPEPSRKSDIARRVRTGGIAGLGAALAIGGMEWFSVALHFPLAVIPFATSIVLVIALPESKPAQPRALVGGHLVATVIGLIVVKLAGPNAGAAAAAVGLAVAAMFITDTLHPPAGINPLLVVSNDLGWIFLIVPVATGALLLLGFAWLWHRAVRRAPWPGRWM